jgi:hypothetical protein
LPDKKEKKEAPKKTQEIKKEPKYKKNKQRNKDPQKIKKSICLKSSRRPPGKTHKLMEEVPHSKDSAQSVVTLAHDPICEEEDAFTLCR